MAFNTTCPVETKPNDPVPFISNGNINFKAHDVGWIVSGFFALVATIASFWLILKHLTYYTVPTQQRHIVRILIMVPIYALVSFLSYAFYTEAIYYQTIRDCYEAVVITSFFYLLLSYLGDTRSDQHDLFRNVKVHKWFWPLGRWKYRPSGLHFLWLMRVGILQYAVVRPVCTIVAVSLQYMNLYCMSSYMPYFGHIYITLAISISVTVAMYCVVQFYLPVKKELEPYKPVLKFLAVKSVVFLTFWQESFISLLIFFGVVKDTQYMTATQIQVGISALAETFEMVVFGFLHIKAFTYLAYRPSDRELKTNRWRSLLHVLDFRDWFFEMRRSSKYVAAKARGEEGLTRYDVRAQRYGHLEKALGVEREAEMEMLKEDERGRIPSFFRHLDHDRLPSGSAGLGPATASAAGRRGGRGVGVAARSRRHDDDDDDDGDEARVRKLGSTLYRGYEERRDKDGAFRDDHPELLPLHLSYSMPVAFLPLSVHDPDDENRGGGGDLNSAKGRMSFADEVEEDLRSRGLFGHQIARNASTSAYVRSAADRGKEVDKARLSRRNKEKSWWRAFKERISGSGGGLGEGRAEEGDEEEKIALGEEVDLEGEEDVEEKPTVSLDEGRVYVPDVEVVASSVSARDFPPSTAGEAESPDSSPPPATVEPSQQHMSDSDHSKDISRKSSMFSRPMSPLLQGVLAAAPAQPSSNDHEEALPSPHVLPPRSEGALDLDRDFAVPHTPTSLSPPSHTPSSPASGSRIVRERLLMRRSPPAVDDKYTALPSRSRWRRGSAPVVSTPRETPPPVILPTRAPEFASQPTHRRSPSPPVRQLTAASSVVVVNKGQGSTTAGSSKHGSVGHATPMITPMPETSSSTPSVAIASSRDRQKRSPPGPGQGPKRPTEVVLPTPLSPSRYPNTASGQTASSKSTSSRPFSFPLPSASGSSLAPAALASAPQGLERWRAETRAVLSEGRDRGAGAVSPPSEPFSKSAARPSVDNHERRKSAAPVAKAGQAGLDGTEAGRLSIPAPSQLGSVAGSRLGVGADDPYAAARSVGPHSSEQRSALPFEAERRQPFYQVGEIIDPQGRGYRAGPKPDPQSSRRSRRHSAGPGAAYAGNSIGAGYGLGPRHPGLTSFVNISSTSTIEVGSIVSADVLSRPLPTLPPPVPYPAGVPRPYYGYREPSVYPPQHSQQVRYAAPLRDPDRQAGIIVGVGQAPHPPASGLRSYNRGYSSERAILPIGPTSPPGHRPRAHPRLSLEASLPRATQPPAQMDRTLRSSPRHSDPVARPFSHPHPQPPPPLHQFQTGQSSPRSTSTLRDGREAPEGFSFHYLDEST